MKANKYLCSSQYLRKGLMQVINYFFHYIECLYLSRIKVNLAYSPIFVIGAPRSGSTLITQVITDAFDIGYLSNHHCKFFGTPVLADKLFHPLSAKKPSDYTSEYGNTKRLYAPAECGEFWYRFFRRVPPYVTINDVRDNKMNCFRNTVSALTKTQDKPILFKNLFATLRIRPINKYIPEALFIIIKRDEVANGHSILQSRMKVHGDYSIWWSVPPPNVKTLQILPPEKQVIEQIRQLYALIEKDIEEGEMDTGRFLTMKYEAFCSDVHGQLERIDKFLQMHGMKIKRLFNVPNTFTKVKKIKIDAGLYKKMVDYSESKYFE
jgi:hypothetical protein